MYRIEQLPLGDVPAAQGVVNRMLVAGAEKHPVLTELRRDVFRGGLVWVLYAEVDGAVNSVPVSVNCTKLGKRRKNVWEPYANWYGAYTLPAERRQGHATALYRVAETAALAAGCRRIKSLAGSTAGAGLHLSLQHVFWGKTLNNELWVDTPLPGFEALYAKEGSPPQAPGARLAAATVRQFMKEGLRYDTQKA